MRKKLLNKKGFSLSELLMVVLILSLLVIIIASGTGVVKDAYEKVTLKAEAQTLMSTTIEKVRDEFRFARDIKQSVILTDPFSFISGNSGLRVHFDNDAVNQGIIMVTGEWKPKPTTPTTPAPQSVPVVTDKTMTSELTTSIEYKYDKENKAEHLITATIIVYQKVKKEDGTIGVGAKEYAKQTFKVKPINK